MISIRGHVFPVAVVLTALLVADAAQPTEGVRPVFFPDGAGFGFDTGALRGALRADGKSLGLTVVTDVASGSTLSRSMGWMSHYRLLDAETRYGDGAWYWPGGARLAPDGSVEATWSPDAGHPFEMKALYRWTTPDTLDVVTTVAATRAHRRFEVFLASYFEGFPETFGYTAAGFVRVTEPMGKWVAFPRDADAVAMLGDGRWQHPPSPVVFQPLDRYAGALGMRRDAATGLTALMMAPPEDCFAVLMPYGEEKHRSLYLSLLGRDLQPGERATARARLIVRRGITDDKAIELYNAYLREARQVRRASCKTPAGCLQERSQNTEARSQNVDMTLLAKGF